MRRWAGLAVTFFVLTITAVLGAPGIARAQNRAAQAERQSGEAPTAEGPNDTTEPPPATSRNANGLGKPLMRNLVSDQEAIWTSPFHLRWTDTDWLLPLAGVTAGFFATDHAAVNSLSSDPRKTKRYVSFSNYGVGALAGIGAGTYLLGRFSHDDHRTETGLLAGEAALDSLAVTTALKYSLRRERPFQNKSGPFFSGGDSFPSDHAAVAWSIAGVVAHEYPGPLTKILVYGLATAVSASRVAGQQHFPSDVFVGAAIGWFTSQYVYRAHHDPELAGSAWETLSERALDSARSPSSKASPYVPLDSWIYPLLERLAALGYIQTAYVSSRPWTRIECAQMVDDAGSLLGQDESATEESQNMYHVLQQEFAEDLSILRGDRSGTVRLESLYTRVGDISGTPLRDSYHFGETIINDFGRPYGEGVNAVSGVSGWASSGRFAIYVRGEYQHAAPLPAYPQQAENLIAQVDQKPVRAAQPIAAMNQFTLLDTYAAMSVDNWELSFGKQSLWWGRGEGGALLLSDNAEPFVMFRARQTIASRLPSIFRHLGPVETDVFFGQLAGNQFPPRPLIHGEKISFKPSANFEISISRTAELGGVGRPLTAAAVFNSYFSVKSSDIYAANASPGKRTVGGDFSYRIPGLRNRLTLYDDVLVPEDNPTNLDMNPSPIYAPRRVAMRPGIYVPRVPGLHKLDFRIEAVYTNPPTPRSFAGQYIYFNNFYRDLYTNKNVLIGDWIGREGTGFQGWTTYWFSPRSTVQIRYRHAKVASDFIPGGETFNDGSTTVNWQVRSDLSVSAGVQYEKWFAPVLVPSPQSNWTSSVDVTFWPRSWKR
jgi:Capsule assembly protein Wzi/PAP2 superfamily